VRRDLWRPNVKELVPARSVVRIEGDVVPAAARDGVIAVQVGARRDPGSGEKEARCPHRSRHKPSVQNSLDSAVGFLRNGVGASSGTQNAAWRVGGSPVPVAPPLSAGRPANDLS